MGGGLGGGGAVRPRGGVALARGQGSCTEAVCAEAARPEAARPEAARPEAVCAG
jgi:hypothetical protein